MKKLTAFFYLIFFWGRMTQAQDTLKLSQQYQNALTAYQKAEYRQAEIIFRELAPKYAIVPEKKAEVELQLVKSLLRQGRLAEAEEITNELQISPTSTQVPHLQNIKGEIYLNKGRNDLASKAFEQAIQQAVQQNNPLAQAQGYANLGLAFWNTGNQELATEYQQKALTIRQANLPAYHAEIAASYNDLGLIYSESNPLQARQYYEKALAIYQKIYGQKHPKLAIAYTNMAITYKSEKNWDEALKQIDSAMNIWEEVYGAQHPNTAFAYTNMGQMQAEIGNYSLAEGYLKQARVVYEKNYGAKHPEIANSYNLLGNLYRKQNNLNKALEHYQRALQANVADFEETNIYQNPNPEKGYNLDILLHSLLMKAEVLEDRHFAKTLSMRDLNTALATLELCDQLLDKIRRTRQSKNDKIALSNTATQLYEYAIRLCLQLREINLNKKYYNEKAFYFAEKSKSAVLLSAIADTEAKEYAGIPTALLTQETHLKNNITRLEQKIAINPTESQSLQDSLFSLKRTYETFIQDLEKNYPDYFNLKYNNQIADLPTLQNILDADASLLLYFIGEKNKRLYVFEITNRNIAIWDLPKHENLDKQITSLRNSIKFRSAKAFVKSSYFLYENLGLSHLSSRKKSVVIIPDGRLGTIPFEALLTKVTSPATSYTYMPYLCKEKSVSYAFSVTLFVQNQRKKMEAGKKQVVLCAPVDFSVHQQPELKGSESEVLRLKDFFTTEGFEVQCYLKKDAEKLLFTKLAQPQILHLATHGAVNEDTPELSQILLSGKTAEEAHLYSSDIYNLRLPVDLVSLSACETGLGKVYRGEGIVGLTRALFYAGAKNIAVSLWTVSDDSTAELMFKFYEKSIKEQKSYGKALQEAKIALQMNEDYAAPYYWAAFILVGK
jgi:CHAT domain-containing protein